MDSRFNIIVSGIVESPVGTSHMMRINSNMDEVSSILFDLSINGRPSVRAHDCRCLSRYQQSAQSPRLILVTLDSTIDASNVFSNCSQLSAHISIHPDLYPMTRKELSIYLGKRY
uniref:Uncharacterized protein n=1 Tax=Amphimedon queenslandica TaxID=400682 RepID=A0A1X7UBA8_AMPQE